MKNIDRAQILEHIKSKNGDGEIVMNFDKTEVDTYTYRGEIHITIKLNIPEVLEALGL